MHLTSTYMTSHRVIAKHALDITPRPKCRRIARIQREDCVAVINGPLHRLIASEACCQAQ